MTTNFIEERLLEKVAFGTSSGVEYKTLVSTLRSGVESRKSQWARPLDRFSVIYRYLKPADREYVIRVFRGCRGRYTGFRFRDPLDYKVVDEYFGIADGAEQELQLIKTYSFGPIEEVREVYKPVIGLKIFADGVQITPTNVDLTTGKVTLTADAGAVLTWTGEFDKPVRFDSDMLRWTLDDKEGGVNPLTSTDIDLTEIRVL